MSESEVTDPVESVKSSLSEAVDNISGWRMLETDSDSRELWRRGSSHIAADYEHLRITPLSSEVALIVQPYDKFGHRVKRTTLGKYSYDQIGWLEDRAVEYMQNFDWGEWFDSPPELPGSVGAWELTSPPEDTEHRVWELDQPSHAAISVEQTDLSVRYGGGGVYYNRVRYSEGDDEHTVATDVPRRSAYEIAVWMMEQLHAPVSHLTDARECLETVAGVGSVKSKQLLHRGITSISGLQTHLNEADPVVNSHHDESVEKIVTGQIRRWINEYTGSDLIIRSGSQ